MLVQRHGWGIAVCGSCVTKRRSSWLPFVARVALLACIGGLAFVVRAFAGFML